MRAARPLPTILAVSLLVPGPCLGASSIGDAVRSAARTAGPAALRDFAREVQSRFGQFAGRLAQCATDACRLQVGRDAVVEALRTYDDYARRYGLPTSSQIRATLTARQQQCQAQGDPT